MSCKSCYLSVLLGVIFFALPLTNPHPAEAQTTFFTDAWSDPGLSLKGQGPKGVELTYSMDQYSLGLVEIDGKILRTVKLPGVFLPNEAGAPNLPALSMYIAVPEGAEVSVHLLDYRTEIISGVDLAPAPIIPQDNDTGPLEYPRNATIYGTNANYPDEPVVLAEISEIRGVSATLLGVSPFLYNPMTQELLVYRDIRLQVTFTGGKGSFGEDRLRSRWFDPILKSTFINGESLPDFTPPTTKGTRSPDFEYLIITPDDPDFITWADTLCHFRSMQGISTGVFTTTEIGGNSVEAIESFIEDAYNNWDIPPVAVLLLGDHSTGPQGIISPIYNNYCVSDNVFADMTGNNLPDIILARMTAQNAEQVETMVSKVLAYETNPPLAQTFYDHPILAGAWQTQRWFTMCTEILHGYLTNNLGKDPAREYALYFGTPGTIWSTATNTKTVVDYFGPSGLGYLPATPEHLTDWGGSALGLTYGINSGTFLLLHRDHGSAVGWGEPKFDTNDLAYLSNDYLPFVFSINCLTGQFDYEGECFAESFHRHPQGALGVIAASDLSYSFVNDTFVWGMFDFIWPDFDPGHGIPGQHMMLPAFASASGKYYLEASSWPYNNYTKEVTYHLFHHHGDAFTTVFSEMPTELAVTHSDTLFSGVNFFNISAPAGSLVGLAVGDELIASAISSGVEAFIPIAPQLPMQEMSVTVTAQNHFRHQSFVEIIQPYGPLVFCTAHAVNDASGDNNGNFDYTEDITLDVTLTNVGTEISMGAEVNISSSDSLVDILEDTQFFGDIPAGESMSLAGIFHLEMVANVPDGTELFFTMVVTDADSTYTSGFSIIAHAPDLVLAQTRILDSNNGFLDPGESASLELIFLNDGSSAAGNLEMILTSLNDNITIASDPIILPTMGPGEFVSTTVAISASSEISTGEVVEVLADVSGTNYEFSTSFKFGIGLIFEDFETGDFLKYPWRFSTVSHWDIDEVDIFEGNYAARSGLATEGFPSTVCLPVDVILPGTLTFMYKVSSEPSADFLVFSMDDTELGRWSGELDWSQASFPVTEGWHEFEWSYIKEGSTDGGNDACWIDFIGFPTIEAPLWPQVEVSPLSIEQSVIMPSLAFTDIDLNNTGAGDLFFELAVYQAAPSPEKTKTLVLKKGEPDPRPGKSADKASGGPDAYGYTWVDSDDPNGHAYNWVEINTLGTLVSSGDDTNAGPFLLGFDFNFYGQTYGQIRICSNGWLSFESSDTAYSNQPIPSYIDPNNMLAPFWDDLDPSDGGAIYYYADSGNNRFIIEYDGVPHYGLGNPETFQVILEGNGVITYQYKTVSSGTGCTVGIENGKGDTGLQVVFNWVYLHDELAIRFTPEEALLTWMVVAPDNGIVTAGTVTRVRAYFLSVVVGIGDYEGEIRISSNDPVQPLIQIPVLLHILPDLSGAERKLPVTFALEHPYPNPFNPLTKIKFSIATGGAVCLEIFDMRGRLVKTLVDEVMTPGYNEVTWDGTDNAGRTVASGAYYSRLKTHDFAKVRKMVLLK